MSRKDDMGKLQWDRLPWGAVEAMMQVCQHGAAKYGWDNWRGVEDRRYLAAAFRHLIAMARGETTDPESGLPHAAHLATNAIILIEKARTSESENRH